MPWCEYQQDTKNFKKYSGIQNIFKHKFISHDKKFTHMPMWHYYQQGISKSTGNQAMLGFKPMTQCRNTNNGAKKDIVQKASPIFQKNKEHPYVFLTPLGRCQTLDICRMGSSCMKGLVNSRAFGIVTERQCCWIHLSGVNLPRATKPAHELSFGKGKDWSKIVLDFWTNNNIKNMLWSISPCQWVLISQIC